MRNHRRQLKPYFGLWEQSPQVEFGGVGVHWALSLSSAPPAGRSALTKCSKSSAFPAPHFWDLTQAQVQMGQGHCQSHCCWHFWPPGRGKRLLFMEGLNSSLTIAFGVLLSNRRAPLPLSELLAAAPTQAPPALSLPTAPHSKAAERTHRGSGICALATTCVCGRVQNGLHSANRDSRNCTEPRPVEGAGLATAASHLTQM